MQHKPRLCAPFTLYARAARRDFGAGTAPVSAYYCFLDEGGHRRGGPIDDTVEQRFDQVLDVVASGIRDGAFPARPGAYDAFFRSFDSCAWCQFDRVCSQGRGELWRQLRTDRRVARYAEVAEPEADAP